MDTNQALELKQGLISALISATGLGHEEIERNLVRAKELAHGDYAFPCFMLAKLWGQPPNQCAEKLKHALAIPDYIERAEAVGPYLNFFLKRAYFAQTVISSIHDQGSRVGGGTQDKTVIVEYSSPNIAKPFHIGHLRTTLIGHSLDRIYRHLGYNVISINHLGDWGTQFGFVWAGCELWGKQTSSSIYDLVELYIKATTLRKAQEEGSVPPEDRDKPAVNEMAREYFKRLEAGEAEALDFWRWCLEISTHYLKNLYERLGIHFDHYTGESFYRDKLAQVEHDVRASGILVESRGALGVELGKPLGFVRVFSEDGRSLYITRDLATADYRYHTFKPYKMLYVVGSPQTFYFKQLIGVLKRMNHPVADHMVHVSYGNVPGISTRASTGSTDKIWLNALLDEAHERALEAYRSQVVTPKPPEGAVEKRPAGLDEEQVAEQVGLGAITFNYLSRSNAKEFHFSWEEALNFQGDTGPYIQYALARLNGIEAKAKEAGISPAGNFSATHIVDDDAHRLVSLLSQFHDTIKRSADEFEPYHVALYLLELARVFSSSYKSLRVVGAETEIARARLALFLAIKQVLQVGLELIGVPPVERM